MKEKIKKYINIGAGFIILGLLTYLLVNQIISSIPLNFSNSEIFGTLFWWFIMATLIYLILKKVYREFKK